MEEEVRIMKALWSADAPIDFDGRFHHLKGASITPQPRTQPRFFLGGGSDDAWNLSARHADVHLFWGDLPERIAANIADLKDRADVFGRGAELGFGMRLQIICRESEAEARAAADALICHIPEAMRERLQQRVANSEANRRVQELAADMGEWITPHLWSGLTRFRPGAGIAVVGNPQQCADTLQQFVDAGCTSFCLSGYLHDAEAERFGRLVRPLIQG
jgi:alkanesulfonate monooxygenase